MRIATISPKAGECSRPRRGVARPERHACGSHTVSRPGLRGGPQGPRVGEAAERAGTPMRGLHSRRVGQPCGGPQGTASMLLWLFHTGARPRALARLLSSAPALSPEDPAAGSPRLEGGDDLCKAPAPLSKGRRMLEAAPRCGQARAACVRFTHCLSSWPAGWPVSRQTPLRPRPSHGSKAHPSTRGRCGPPTLEASGCGLSGTRGPGSWCRAGYRCRFSMGIGGYRWVSVGIAEPRPAFSQDATHS